MAQFILNGEVAECESGIISYEDIVEMVGYRGRKDVTVTVRQDDSGAILRPLMLVYVGNKTIVNAYLTGDG